MKTLKKRNTETKMNTGGSRKYEAGPVRFYLVSHHCKHNAGLPIKLPEEQETLLKTWFGPVRYFCKLHTNVVLKFQKQKEYMSEKTGRGCMLNTFYLWSEPVSRLPEIVLFEVAGWL